MKTGENKMNTDNNHNESKKNNKICIKVRVKTKIYTCMISDKFTNLKHGDRVILSLNGEQEYGTVASSPFNCTHFQDKDFPFILNNTFFLSEKEKELLEEKETSIMKYCTERAKHYKLDMEFIKAEYALDKSKIVLYFTAEKRIDFRELVKDINNYLKTKTRVELWQISAREKAVLIGGIGICGLEICCRKLCQIPDTVSIRTVKDQHLEINPLKITGICGKLMCCLTYEHQQYVEMSKGFPKVGKRVIINDKTGIIKSCNILKGTVTVEVEEGGTMELEKDLIKLEE